jgi:hypothetical protein
MLASTARRRTAAAGVVLLLSAAAAQATTLVQMNMKDLVTRADKVFRGTVVAIDTTTVRAGGGDLPVIVYKLRVQEVFKGNFDEHNGEPVIELKMLGLAKADRGSGPVQSRNVLRDLPRFEMGREYVLFTTAPSAIGLSTTVGLGQGAFTILGAGKEEMTVNAFNNAGLNRGQERPVLPGQGAVPYTRLAQAIRAALNE